MRTIRLIPLVPAILNKMNTDMITYTILFINFCLAISVHEYAHAWAAYRLGDDTARAQGRMTLNPLAHLDPIGTFCLLFGYFGWGKPVPVNPANLKDPRRDGVWISAAGPSANLLLAILFASVLWILWIGPGSFLWVGQESLGIMVSAIIMGILLNLSLMFFNLLPIFPLDGEKVIVGLIPARWVRPVLRLRSYGMVVLLVLLASKPLLDFSIIGWFAGKIIYPVYCLLVPSGLEMVL